MSGSGRGRGDGRGRKGRGRGRQGRGPWRGGRGRGGRHHHPSAQGNGDGRRGPPAHRNNSKNHCNSETTDRIPLLSSTQQQQLFPFCFQEECEERQSLKQVHELETTVETCQLPQAQRMLDPSLAVAKYRRSAAGSSSHTKTRNRQPLQATLDHLLRIAATRQASPHHPPTSMIPWAEFCVDRLRACQADATRLENDPHPVPSSWHAKLARILIWIRYWTLELRGGDAWMPQTIQKLLSTALEKYWIAKENERTTETTTTTVVEEEDEILSFSALLRMSQQPLPNRFYQSILLDYSKHVVVDKEKPLSSNNYPLFHLALQLASHLVREEYYVVWKQPPHTKCHFSILQKCCLAPSLPLWRYRTVQHFNSSFAKHEAVADMPRLLKQSPPLDHHQLNNFDSFGLPVETREDGNNETTTVLILKSVAMKDDDPLYTTPRRDDAWVFGASSSNDDVDVVISDDNNNQDDMRRGDDQLAPLMGLSSERICQLLERPKQT